MTSIRQVFTRDAHHWPSGLPQAAALFSTLPEEITARTGVAFEAGVDDLDYFRAVGLELLSGRRVLLIWHERAPVLGLELRIDMADDTAAARAETMTALGLTATDVLWEPAGDESLA